MNKEEIDIDLYGLIFWCPQGKRKDSCPISLIDDLPFDYKVSWLQQMKKNQQDSLLKLHYSCNRMKNQH